MRAFVASLFLMAVVASSGATPVKTLRKRGLGLGGSGVGSSSYLPPAYSAPVSHSLGHVSVPSASYGVPSTFAASAPAVDLSVGHVGSSSYVAPSPAYVTPSASYGTPSASYVAPSTSYSAPSISYAAASASHSAPSISYAAPSASYGAPSISYAAPSASHGAPSISYAAPSASYGVPSTSYVAPSTSYGVPSVADFSVAPALPAHAVSVAAVHGQQDGYSYPVPSKQLHY